MITFWTPRNNGSIGTYRSNRGRAIAGRFTARHYEEMAQPMDLSAGTHLFAALDQLSPVQRQAVSHVWDEHARVAPRARRLNDPRRALLRFDLLRRLKAEGLNTFSVYRHDEIDAISRFPVFVREIYKHNGPRTRLLDSRDQVRQAITALRIRGWRRDNLMIVEYADASGADGLFRKYAAFCVGDRIIACHVFSSREWCVKSEQNEVAAQGISEDLEYVRGNPHAAWLARVFDAAGIDYGRIDYGVSGGQPQAWEINLNPTIGRQPGQSKQRDLSPDLKAARESTRELFHEQLRAAFVALDDESTATCRVTLGQQLQADLIADGRARERRNRIRDWARAFYESPTLGSPVRKAYSLFPRR